MRVTRRGIAVLLALAAVPLLAVDVISLAVAVPWAAVGALLAIKRPRNAIGPLLIAFAWAYVLTSDPAIEPAVLIGGGYDWTIGARLLIAKGIGYVVFALLFLLTVIFPDGRLPAFPWRVPVVALVATCLAIAALAMFLPVIPMDLEDGTSIVVPNPIAVPVVGELVGALYQDGTPFLVLLGAVGAGVISLAVRRHRATGIQRQQLTWLVVSIVAITLAVLLAFTLLGIADSSGTDVGGTVWIPALFTYPLPPLAIAVAVLRYRLYEIDRVVSRSIAYALITAVLLVVFAGTVVASQTLLTGVTGGDTIPVALSTLLVFALFQPLRSRVQRLVDRRFNRRRLDAQRAIDTFGHRLRDEVDLLAVREATLRTASSMVEPVSATLWVRRGTVG